MKSERKKFLDSEKNQEKEIISPVIIVSMVIAYIMMIVLRNDIAHDACTAVFFGIASAQLICSHMKTKGVIKLLAALCTVILSVWHFVQAVFYAEFTVDFRYPAILMAIATFCFFSSLFRPSLNK